MSKIVAFGASNSSKSINQQFAIWVAEQTGSQDTRILNLNDFEMPIFSVDREQSGGIPDEAIKFKEIIKEADGVIISFAEYNGSYSSAFKNIFDWISRIERPIWAQKPMFLTATSPGPRGGRTVLETALRSFPRQGGEVLSSFSLPSFNRNFEIEIGITDQKLKDEFNNQLENFKQKIHETQIEATPATS